MSNQNAKKTARPTQKRSSTAAPKRKQRKTRLPRNTIAPTWFDSVCDPFNHEPTAIPDQATEPTMKCSSRAFIEYAGDATNGFAIAFAPWLISPSDFPSGGGVVSTLAYSNSTGLFTSNQVVTSGTSIYGGKILQNYWPNTPAIIPAVDGNSNASRRDYRYRPTAMAIRLTPELAELYRNGTIVLGQCDPITSVGTSLNPDPMSLIYGGITGGSLSPAVSATTFTMQQLRNRMRRLATERMPDGSIMLRMIPTGTLDYAEILKATSSSAYAGLTNWPILLMATTSSPTGSANYASPFVFDVIIHWEITVSSRYATAIQPTPSPYDPRALAYCLNKFQTLGTSYDESTGSVLPDGHQAPTGTSAWESIPSAALGAFNAANSALYSAYSASQTPLGRLALGYLGSKRRAGNSMLLRY